MNSLIKSYHKYTKK